MTNEELYQKLKQDMNTMTRFMKILADSIADIQTSVDSVDTQVHKLPRTKIIQDLLNMEINMEEKN